MYEELALQAGAAAAYHFLDVAGSPKHVLDSKRDLDGRRLAHSRARKAKLTTPATVVLEHLPMMLAANRQCAASQRMAERFPGSVPA